MHVAKAISSIFYTTYRSPSERGAAWPPSMAAGCWRRMRRDWGTRVHGGRVSLARGGVWSHPEPVGVEPEPSLDRGTEVRGVELPRISWVRGGTWMRPNLAGDVCDVCGDASRERLQRGCMPAVTGGLGVAWAASGCPGGVPKGWG